MKQYTVLLFIAAVSVIFGASFIPNPLPEYCNADGLSEISPMSASEISKVSSLKQVLVMIRHGSRTPYAAGMSCWEGYDVQWNDCNVTELMLPSPALYNYSSEARPEKWLFRLIYDAFPDELGGNCMTGQLVHQGFVQEEANGRALAELYLNNDANPSLNLFDTNDFNLIDQGQLYLRSDDEQRTLMSGQIVLSRFFNATHENVVSWHTMDDAIDQIAPNSQACPALSGISAAAYSSANFTAENTSDATITLTSNLNDVWGEGWWSYYNTIDCIMTTVCTGRGIPSNSGTGDAMTQSLLTQAIDQATYIYAYQALYNESYYSKLGMGQTTWQMRSYLEEAVNNNPTAIKFGLWSAHDTSIMPFLAALMGPSWDQQWARYAAMVTIEVYNSSTSDDGGEDLFRLTYDGEALAMPGCGGATLCPVSVLLDLMAFGEEFPAECVYTAPISNDDDGSDRGAGGTGAATIQGIPLGGWIGLCLMSGIIGLLIGMGVIFFCTGGKNGQGYCGVANTDNSSTHGVPGVDDKDKSGQGHGQGQGLANATNPVHIERSGQIMSSI